MGCICPETNFNPALKFILRLRATEDKEVEEIWRRRTEMPAIVGLHLRGSEDRRNAKKRKHSHSRNKPMESRSRRLIVNLVWCVHFFLLFVLPGAASVPVEGLKGGSVTLNCSLSNREDLTYVLIFGSKIAYGFNQDERFKTRVHKNGSCDLILQDLKTTDAGKYTADIYDKSGLISSNSFDIHVKVSLTGQKGEELMFDELPREAENVMHLTNAGWTEVWRSGQGVLTDRLIDKNGRLTIKNLSSSDAGIYRVLNSSGGILVTVMVTAFSTDPSAGSKDKHDGKHKDEPHDTEYDGVWIGIGVVVALVVLVALIVFAVKKICLHLIKKHCSSQCKTQYRGPDHRTTAVVT